ncbi:glucose-6-phosphate isomerase [Citrobacter amalonaticus]|uniref:glucose-6-phosphate isomerase n=1 Tax=Citrobacter amalonaticus TaxID=35703 RepID=A0A2S4RX75_CITAM|nr:glucose-6-phosphate isomerase family protein [Citrobacter amalonaticus]POT56024.1 glucose-6-phosphate isomerase [Citrobacter amalonaticus]POT74332.1 glucose-6-phosphate isomerase [Citrobacter amalonaticus]POU65133.1 glucose-6-phosphate isomerase [Citrobacter amalonaticus]POV03967.1 glucose-6-phosphate isomerase [Citrobacter amalonaticus]
MNLSFIQPPQVAWASGALAGGSLSRKSTRVQDLVGVFADEPARQLLAGEQIVYDVEILDTSSAEGELYTGVTHLYPGRVGGEFFMTRGHFHARREQGEVYFGLCGNGLLLLQNEQGEARLEKVFAGSVHIIPGFTAHRLINTGSEVLSALAVWPTVAGHDYAALAKGFSLRVFEVDHNVQVKAVQHG